MANFKKIMNNQTLAGTTAYEDLRRSMPPPYTILFTKAAADTLTFYVKTGDIEITLYTTAGGATQGVEVFYGSYDSIKVEKTGAAGPADVNIRGWK